MLYPCQVHHHYIDTQGLTLKPVDAHFDGNDRFERFATWYPNHNMGMFIQVLQLLREHRLVSKSDLLGKSARTFSNLH